MSLTCALFLLAPRAVVGLFLDTSAPQNQAALGLAARLDAKRAKSWGLTVPQHDHLAARYLLPQPPLAIAHVVGRDHAIHGLLFQ